MRAVALVAIASTAYALVCLSCAAGSDDDDDGVPTGPVASASASGSSGSGGATGASTASATNTNATTTTSATTVTGTTQAASTTSGPPVCGDGVVGPGETCDDANTDQCGTCTADCLVAQTGHDCPAGVGCASPADCACGCDAGTCSDAYAHTLVIDGQNDFGADETFTSTSAGYTGFVGWDATYVYFGMQGADVGSTDGARFFFVDLGDGTGGTMTGPVYNTQSPTLPFLATHHLRWKADNSFTNALTWNGAAWVDAGLDFTGDVFQSGDYVEMRIPRAEIGNPSSLEVALGMLTEQDGAEATYAGVPASAYVDGYDPDIVRLYLFDLSACAAPSTYTAL